MSDVRNADVMYEAGENNVMADWDIALDDLLPEDVEALPTQVAGYVRSLKAENARLQQVIAHLMTNPLDTDTHTCCTSDIDAQTGRVTITEDTGDHTTIRIEQ